MFRRMFRITCIKNLYESRTCAIIEASKLPKDLAGHLAGGVLSPTVALIIVIIAARSSGVSRGQASMIAASSISWVLLVIDNGLSWLGCTGGCSGVGTLYFAGIFVDSE